MRLLELEPQWLKILGEKTFQRTELTIDEADGIVFLCPKCFVEKGGPIGTHSIICWRPRVPQDIDPKPGRWEFEGTGFNDLTLVAGSSSILLLGGCNAHFFIRNGGIA